MDQVERKNASDLQQGSDSLIGIIGNNEIIFKNKHFRRNLQFHLKRLFPIMSKITSRDDTDHWVHPNTSLHIYS